MITVGKVTTSTLGNAAVSMVAVGDVLLGTTDSGCYSAPGRVAIIPVSVFGLVTTPTVSIGTNSPNFDNIVPPTDLVELTLSVLSGGKAKLLNLSEFPLLAAGTEIYARTSIAAVATSYVCKIGVEVAED